MRDRTIEIPPLPTLPSNPTRLLLETPIVKQV
jgi:hypothetical protein